MREDVSIHLSVDVDVFLAWGVEPRVMEVMVGVFLYISYGYLDFDHYSRFFLHYVHMITWIKYPGRQKKPQEVVLFTLLNWVSLLRHNYPVS